MGGFCTPPPPPAIVEQPLRGMSTNMLGKTKDTHVQVYPTTNLVHTAPPPPVEQR